MDSTTVDELLQAIIAHAGILAAAVTGSLARAQAVDRHSDLDALLVATNVDAVADVRTWWPAPLRDRILICERHLGHYCTVMLDGLGKVDLAIFEADDPSSSWVVHDYRVVKGDGRFQQQLAAAANATRSQRAAHENRDVCVANVILLLATARSRLDRGERLSSRGFVAMAADMVAGLERRRLGVEPGADLLDPRRRLEQSRPDFAALLDHALATDPARGIEALARHVADAHRSALSTGEAKALESVLRSFGH